jgi:hypothetical protein
MTCTNGECQPCGGPNQRCCADRACNNGGCCVGTVGTCYAAGSNCPMAGVRGMCMAGKCSGCGSMGQACCPNDECYDAGATCINNMCGACGGVGAPSCKGNVCTAGQCLNSDQECIATGTMCGGNAGTCNANGSCTAGMTTCGGMGQPCCEIGGTQVPRYCSQPGTTCGGNANNATCVACGAVGQPCCDGETCKTGTCNAFMDRCQ